MKSFCVFILPFFSSFFAQTTVESGKAAYLEIRLIRIQYELLAKLIVTAFLSSS